MLFNYLKFNAYTLFSLFYILSLTSSLFYTGNNTWLFTASYIFLVINLALILKQRFYNPIKLPINGILISAVLLLIWFGISFFPSQIKYLSVYNFFWVGSLIIVFLLFSFNDNKDQIWKTVWPAILLLVTIWAIYGLVQYYYLHVPTNASFLNRNTLAALINLALLPASGYFLLLEKDRPWEFLSDKVLTLALGILFLATFIITSRGASLSLIIGFIFLLSMLFKHIERQKIYSLLIIIFVSFLLVTISQYFIADLPDGFADRMMTLQDSSKAGNTRFIIWESLIPLFKEMPWYGLGLGSLWLFWPPYRPATDTSAGFFAHNDYMQITLEAGYPGIILLVALFIFILLGFVKAIKASSDNNNFNALQRVEIVSLFSALATFAAHSLFTYNFYILPLLLIAGLYLGRFNQLAAQDSILTKTLPAFQQYFKPIMFIISSLGL
ncbi:MAG: O-antigen ligase family protein, partial [Gammaproteobacteria bacterium]|nr:O-antigen ligase family protein [Gammaproteobacteria bacterium]